MYQKETLVQRTVQISEPDGPKQDSLEYSLYIFEEGEERAFVKDYVSSFE